jgi:hypothetical protein
VEEVACNRCFPFATVKSFHRSAPVAQRLSLLLCGHLIIDEPPPAPTRGRSTTARSSPTQSIELRHGATLCSSQATCDYQATGCPRLLLSHVGESMVFDPQGHASTRALLRVGRTTLLLPRQHYRNQTQGTPPTDQSDTTVHGLAGRWGAGCAWGGGEFSDRSAEAAVPAASNVRPAFLVMMNSGSGSGLGRRGDDSPEDVAERTSSMVWARASKAVRGGRRYGLPSWGRMTKSSTGMGVMSICHVSG